MSARDNPSRTRAHPRRLRVALLGATCGVVGVGLAIALGGVPAGFPLDDAWTHMVYGRALAHGEPFAYSPGETASGFTSPLWMVVLALAHLLLERISIDALVTGVQVLGATAHVASAALAARITHRLTRREAPALVAAAVLGGAPALANASLSGMEVAATGAALLGALAAALGGRPSTRPWRMGGWLAAAVMLRPEALCVVAVLGAVALLARRRAALADVGRAAVPVAIACLAMVAAYFAASGRPLPATFYFKQSLSLAELPNRLALVLGDVLPTSAPFLGYAAYLFVAGAAAAPRWNRLPCALPALLGTAWMVAVALVVPLNDPAAFYFQRYFLPAAPLLIVAMAVGAHALGQRFSTDALRPVPLAALALVALGATVVSAPTVSRHRASDVRNTDEVQRAMGELLARIVPEDGRIATCDAGAVRYFSGRPTVDMLGLNSPDLWWVGEPYVEAHPVTHVAIMPAWVQPTRGRERLQPIRTFHADPYTVTSSPRQSTQYVAACRADGAVWFEGTFQFPVLCRAVPQGGAGRSP